MKKKIIIGICIVLAIVLLTPIPIQLKDGGTKVYTALTYKIVKWNHLYDNGEVYDDTEIYLFPLNFKTTNELWERKMDMLPNVISESNSILRSNSNVKTVSVKSLPTGYDYSFSENDAKAIYDYFSELTLVENFSETPDEYDGMTWVVSIEYENGEIDTLYHFGNMFFRTEGGSWYKMKYEEASQLDELLNELNK